VVRAIAAIAVAFASISTPIIAAAQVVASASLKSDERFRGRSLSKGHPTATLELSYDHRDGAYVGGSATVVFAGREDSGLLSTQVYVGYATRTSNGLDIDLGIAGHAYTDRYSGESDDRYAEFHASVSKGMLSLQARYAPNDQGRDTPTAYLGVGASKSIARDWAWSARVGALVQTSGAPALGGRRFRYDTSLGLRRRIAAYELEARWTLGGPDDAYFDGPWQGASALVLSVRRGL